LVSADFNDREGPRPARKNNVIKKENIYFFLLNNKFLVVAIDSRDPLNRLIPMGIRAKATDLSADTNGDSRKNKLIPMGIRAKKTVAESAATNDFLEMRPTNPHTSALRRKKNGTKTTDLSQKNTPPSMHPHTSALRRKRTGLKPQIYHRKTLLRQCIPILARFAEPRTGLKPRIYHRKTLLRQYIPILARFAEPRTALKPPIYHRKTPFRQCRCILTN
jgi:hypothetical protein